MKTLRLGIRERAGLGVLVMQALFFLSCPQAQADFTRDFRSFDAAAWESPRYFGAGGIDPDTSYEGTPDTLDAVIVDGSTALRMTSVMTNLQRKAIATKRRFRFLDGSIRMRFKTMPPSDPTVPATNKENIDGLVDFWLVNPESGAYLNFRLFGGEFGGNRIAFTRSSLGAGAGAAHAAWGYGNWYELTIESRDGETVIRFLSQDGTAILEHRYDFDLCALGTFQVVLGQMMGRPDIESYADVAIDFLHIDEHAECPDDDGTPTLCEVGPADEAVTVPAHPTTPACRCFQDPAARSDTHCMFVHPLFSGVWRYPPNVPPHEPFQIERFLVPHTKVAAFTRTEVAGPRGFEGLDKTQRADGAPAGAIERIWILAGDKPGPQTLEMRFMLPNANQPLRARFPISVNDPGRKKQ